MNKYFRSLLQTQRKMKQTWRVQPLHLSSISTTDKRIPENNTAFDPQILDILACPLSKKPLRYDQANNELVSDEIGVAYPIVDGIPNLNPVHGRIINKEARKNGGDVNSSDR